MPSLQFLEALRSGFWPLYVLALTMGAFSYVKTRRVCVLRTTMAFAAASVVQYGWEADVPLTWWQHMVIDVPVFIAVTTPPRHYWQSVIGALVLVQLLAHVMWFAGADYPNAGRMHWLTCILVGYLKCIVLVLWAGGARVEVTLGSIARVATRLVHRPPFAAHER